MHELVEKLAALAKTHDLTKFYNIDLGRSNKIAFQGYFNDDNIDFARYLDVELKLEGHFLRGENEYYRVTLTA